MNLTIRSTLVTTAVLLAIAALLARSAAGAAFRVSPVQVQLAPGEKIASITVINDAEEMVTVQVSVLAWHQNEEGRDITTETGDLVVLPKIFQLAKGQERVVRLALRKNIAASAEATYRLLVQELPVDAPGQTAVRFVLQMSLPVFVQPSQPRLDWAIEQPELGPTSARVLVRNTGNAHIKISQVTMTANGDGGSELFTRDSRGWYVLAGNSRVFGVPMSAEECIQVRRLAVTVETAEERKKFESGVEGDPSLCTAKENTSPAKADSR